MPLGVDHFDISSYLQTAQQVRKPLMPLGVDHLLFEGFNFTLQGAKTFDAIRR